MTGFNSKRQMVSESVHWSDCAVHNGPAYPAGECDCGAAQPWNEDEWRRNNWRCGHGWLRGEQCEICNAAQPAQEPVGYVYSEAGVKHGAIQRDLPNGTPLYAAPLPAQPAQEPVAHFGSAYVNENGVHITTVLGPVAIPQDAKLYTISPQRPWVGLTQKEVQEIHDTYHKRMGLQEFALALIANLKEKNNG
jgi:hypothetical protein